MQSAVSEPGPYRTGISPMRIRPSSEPGTGEEAERILLLAPTGRDAKLMARILGEAGFATAICSDVPHLCAELQRGGGAAVAAEEALGRSGSAHLKAALAAQPSWSDLPLTILLGAGASPESSQALLADLGQQGNLTLLGRPVRTITLVSSLQAAIRARCRQYEVRNHLAERAHAQAALERSEARYRSLTLPSVSIVWITTDTGDFAAELPSWQAYTGQSRASYEGWGWLEAVHPEDRERVAATWREALATMAVYQSEYRLARHDGEYRRVTARAVPVASPDATLHEWVGTCTDIEEERRAAEMLHQTARQLQQAQKMEAVGRLAGGVAHDFNNLLTAVIGHADLALAAADPAGRVHADVERIRSAATKAAAVTGQLLTFSRKQKLDLRIVDLGRLVTELAATLHPMLGEDVRLELSLAPDLGLVRADPALLEQVLMNLTVNARDAMPNGGSLTIEMANVDFAEAALVTKAHLPPGAYVMLEVSDTGVGMTPDVQARIFEPFFTTKGPTKGTGLGLAMVYGIVTQSGGQISVYSEPGAGSTFKLYLPRVMAETGEPLPVPTEARAAGGTETVLLAEDNEAVRVLAERVLRSEGYAVLVAAHGYEALQLAQAHAGPIHLLLTDVMMPGMSGPRLAEELERDRPETAVLFMSGYTEQTVIERGSLREGITYLQKPFTPGVLIRRVREMLDASRRI